MKRYAYMYGNPGHRKMRSPWFASKFDRDLNAWADHSNGFKVRTYETQSVYYGA